MATTLAPDEFSDAQLTESVARGDFGSAARIWIRLWPIALDAAREIVEADEAQGIAAEALIRTIASLALGRELHETLAGAVTTDVRILSDGAHARTTDSSELGAADVARSQLMSEAFIGLPREAQRVLWLPAAAASAEVAGEVVEALTKLQFGYLHAHSELSAEVECPPIHVALAAAVDETDQDVMSAEEWDHLSSCGWCTEAFHELAFSNVALTSLVDRRVEVAPAVAEPASTPYDAVVGAVVGEGDDLVDPLLVAQDFVDQPVLTGRAAAVLGQLVLLRDRHGRVATAAALGVAVIAAVAVVVVSLAGHQAPAQQAAGSAGHTSSPSSLSTPKPAAPAKHTASTVSTGHATAAGSSSRSAQAVTVVDTSSPASGAPTATKTTSKPTRTSTKTTKTGTSGSSSTPTPTPAPPTPSPTPSPTPTPTPCGPIAGLLGVC